MGKLCSVYYNMLFVLAVTIKKCFTILKIIFFFLRGILISVGSNDADKLQNYEMKRCINHPDDRIQLALMELKEELKMSESVQPIALPNISEKTPVGTKCLLTGRGYSKTSFRFPSKLHGANLKIITCKSDDVTKICAGPAGPAERVGNDRNACVFDDGDPLACTVGTEKKLVGVAGLSLTCGNAAMPYISVANFRSWINEITGI